MFQVNLDERSWMQISALMAFAETWTQLMHHSFSQDIAKASIEYMKPLMHVRDHYTGALESSLRHETNVDGDGFETSFYGLWYGQYMDEGNFPADQEMWAPRGAVKRAFPVDSRFGNPTYSPVIHGMGYHTPGAPTHFSEKTVEWLANGTADELGMLYMNQFIERMVTA